MARVRSGFETVTLQSAKIIGVAEFSPQGLKYGEISLAALGTKFPFEMPAKVLRYPVIVEQRIINIEKKDYVIHQIESLLAALGALGRIHGEVRG